MQSTYPPLLITVRGKYWVYIDAYFKYKISPNKLIVQILNLIIIIFYIKSNEILNIFVFNRIFFTDSISFHNFIKFYDLYYEKVINFNQVMSPTQVISFNLNLLSHNWLNSERVGFFLINLQIFLYIMLILIA